MTRTMKSLALLGVAALFAVATSARADNTGLPGSMAVGITGGNMSVAAPGIIGIGSTANATASNPKQLGIGSNVHQAPAYISTYSAPSYAGGNYVTTINAAAAVSNYRIPTPSAFTNSYSGLTSTSSNFLGGPPGFVSPPIMFQPNFTPLNYTGLPGDFYARSTYYVPRGVSPIVVYPSPLAAASTIGSFGATRSVGARPLSSGGLLNGPAGGVHSQLSHGVIPNR